MFVKFIINRQKVRGHCWCSGLAALPSTCSSWSRLLLVLCHLVKVTKNNFTSETILGLIPRTIHPLDITPLPFTPSHLPPRAITPLPHAIHPPGQSPPNFYPVGFLPTPIPFTPQTFKIHVQDARYFICHVYNYTHLGLFTHTKCNTHIRV